MDVLFLLKKCLGLLCMPLPVIIGLLVVGLILLWTSRGRILAQALLAMAAVLSVLTSYAVFPDMALRRLERFYPPLDIALVQGGAVPTIVVLGGGHYASPGMTALTQLSPDSLVRLTEGIRLYRLLPSSRLLLSGGRIYAREGDAAVMARAAVDLGVDPADIELETASRDTKDQARIIKTMLGRQPFVLVTSAYHMPRSVALFKAQDMQPLPAPVGQLAADREGFSLAGLFPRAVGIEKTEIVLHEVLGILSAAIMGQI